MPAGYIYVLSNRSMPGMVKIGKTTRDPRTRAGELYASGVPTPFIIEATIETPDVDLTERAVHTLLSASRVSKKREFFHASISEAVDALQAATRQAPGKFRPKKHQHRYGRKTPVKDVPLASALVMANLPFATISTFHPYASYAWLFLCLTAASLGTPPVLKDYLAILGKGLGVRHVVVGALGLATFMPPVGGAISQYAIVLSDIVKSYLSIS